MVAARQSGGCASLTTPTVDPGSTTPGTGEAGSPLFHVPKWLEEQPEAITDFARRGFATVISLPVRDQPAEEAVAAEIAAVRNQTVPMLLFLRRLERLSIRVILPNGGENGFVLTRSEQAVEAAKVSLAVANLGDAGRYLLARRKVPETAMKAAIKDGTDKKQLHKHWLKWEGEGEVALAVSLALRSRHRGYLRSCRWASRPRRPLPAISTGASFPRRTTSATFIRTERRCPAFLRSPWTTNVFCRLPTSTMKPGRSVSRAKYCPEDAGWRPAIARSVRASRRSVMKLVRH